MPVETQKSFQIKLACDRLAYLLSSCADSEFEKRVNLLNDLCNDWSQADQNIFSQLNASIVPSSFKYVGLETNGSVCSSSDEDVIGVEVVVNSDDRTDSSSETVVKQESREECNGQRDSCYESGMCL
jgi:hypothetical protein